MSNENDGTARAEAAYAEMVNREEQEGAEHNAGEKFGDHGNLPGEAYAEMREMEAVLERTAPEEPMVMVRPICNVGDEAVRERLARAPTGLPQVPAGVPVDRIIQGLQSPLPRMQKRVVIIRSDDAGKFRSDVREEGGDVAMVELAPRNFVDVTRLALTASDVVKVTGENWTQAKIVQLREGLRLLNPEWGGLMLVDPEGDMRLEKIPASALRLFYTRMGVMLRTERAELEEAARAVVQVWHSPLGEPGTEFLPINALIERLEKALEALSPPAPKKEG